MIPIASIDYGAGNLTSVKKALAAVGADVFVPGSPGEIAGAEAIVVPGVGHFGATTRARRAWSDAIPALVGDGRPLLGICLGMQWLFEGSEEAPDCPGLGVLPAVVTGCAGRRSRTPEGPARRVERAATAAETTRLLDGCRARRAGVFHAQFRRASHRDTVAETSTVKPFASIVQRGRIAGVQFHPEKSGDVGLRILRNFVRSA